jgi:hypothetical protein
VVPFPSASAAERTVAPVARIFLQVAAPRYLAAV